MDKNRLPKALILALADPIKQAKLRTVCERLKEKGKTYDYANDKEISYLELLTYGAGGVSFARINELFDKKSKE